MKLSDFSYDLPKSFIAQYPISERGKSKMLFYDREKRKTEHLIFSDIVEILQPQDLVILNKTKVFPARLIAEGIEILLVKEREKNVWEVLARPRKKLKDGARLCFGDIEAEVISGKEGIIRFNCEEDILSLLEDIGKPPLPPYIKRPPEDMDKSYYQTIYAEDIGSIAAPTAGFHWTEDIISRVLAKGVSISYITLHIGIGTFKTIRKEDIKEHKMDIEYGEIKERIDTKKRIIACGTSVVRAIESLEDLEPKRFQTDIFIYPGFKFKWTKGMITNFHLPKSPPFILTSSFVGLSKLKELYEEAKSCGYRFGSYGDCMFVL